MILLYFWRMLAKYPLLLQYWVLQHLDFFRLMKAALYVCNIPAKEKVTDLGITIMRNKEARCSENLNLIIDKTRKKLNTHREIYPIKDECYWQAEGYKIEKLPLILSKFHKQMLLAWSLIENKISPPISASSGIINIFYLYLYLK